MKFTYKKLLLLMSLGLLVLGSGCTTTSMKGTPFYSGEYSSNLGHAEDRINLWPLLYYRDPALSILWPFIELSDTHLALRPLFSIYERNTDEPTYNLLWPLGHFDTALNDYRFFPVFWGDDYRVGFPLYWHFGKPLDNKGSDVLFPLWSYSSHGKDSYNLHLLWPVFNRKHISDNNSGWRVWPLAGSYDNHGDIYRFALWPLGHQWQHGSYGGSMLFPLYYHSHDGDDDTFVSLPYSRSRHDDVFWETLLPVYHRRHSASNKSFYSLFYSSATNSLTRTDWSLAIPLWYRHSDPHETLVATLLGGLKRSDERTAWFALPLLSGGSRTPTASDTWYLGPLAHTAHDDETRISQSHIFPLYYHHSRPESSAFYSLIWSSATNTAESSAWQLLAPIYYHSSTPTTKTTITPLYAWGSDADKKSKWHGIVPLVINRRTPTEHLLATPLGGYLQTTNSSSWLAWPLLSGGSSSPTSTSFWAAAPLIHASWNSQYASHHVLPLYYWNGQSRNFISLPYARWNSAKSTTTIIPPLLSWRTASANRSDTWLLGPLAHLSSGTAAGPSHIFPLYYHDKQKHSTISLPYATFQSGQTDYTVYPLLLSMYTSSDTTKNFYSIAGLFRQQWGQDATTISHLWPIYDYRAKDHFYSPLFGWKNGRRGYIYPFTPLVGIRKGAYSGGWLFPLWSRCHDRTTGYTTGTFLWGTYAHSKNISKSGIFPIYGYYHSANKRSFWSLPACWYSSSISPGDSTTIEHGFFPFWSHSSTTIWPLKFAGNLPATAEADTAEPDPDLTTKEPSLYSHGSLLLFLYDYKHEKTPASSDTGATDYTRRRILWRLWHYERLNNDVSIDIFPAITYDSKANGFHKASFLWRLFRYENGPNGKKLDLLFIPLIRKNTKP
jgi:hypothetical protein